jgi:syntaxin 1B/2/3
MELAQLFQDLQEQVTIQNEAVIQTEQATEVAKVNIDEGNTHLGKGIASAKRARKLKWCLFFLILFIIIAIVVAIVAWYFVAGPGAHKNNN